MSLRTLGDISRAVVQIPSRSKLTTGGLLLPNGRGRGVRALLEPRCVGTERTEYLHVGFKSSDGYVLIVYAFMYAFIIHYWIISTECAILYAQIVPRVGVEPTLGG
jgi:hypothetical protein